MISMLCVGKVKAYAAEDAVYLQRMRKQVELKIYPTIERMAEAVARDRYDVVWLCDEAGKQYSSLEFAKIIDTHLTHSRTIALCVAPAEGWGNMRDVFSHAHLISLSKFTMPHDLARHVLIEQLYRAMTIIAGHPYHKP